MHGALGSPRLLGFLTRAADGVRVQRIRPQAFVYLADVHPESADYDDNCVRQAAAAIAATPDRQSVARVVRTACVRWLRLLRGD